MLRRSVFAWLCLWLLSTSAYAGTVQVHGVRMWPAPDNTRLVFDVSAPLEHNLFTLNNPERIVIDLKNTKLLKPVVGLDYSESLLNGIRTASRNGGDLRVVLDLKGKVRPKSFVLRPNQAYGHRLVIDLHDQGEAQQKAVSRVKSMPEEARDVVIAIDAGHGGDDPGASGPNRVREKDVVLAIARHLKKMVDKEPGMRAVMIRDGDYFIGLKKRMEKARDYRADLFVSIHADAFNDPRARGSSVYVLSRDGASSEQARLLAEKENASDLIGGVSLDDKDGLLASVLLDLSQTATLEASSQVAQRVLKGIKKVNKLHKRKVEKAGFKVLKAPDVPSILVETAFISNPGEERKLKSSRHQRAMASAIMEGVRGYFHKSPPPGTLLARRSQTHTIARGETLSAIARQYRVSLNSLRNANDLKSDRVHIGKVLRIPFSSDS